MPAITWAAWFCNQLHGESDMTEYDNNQHLQNNSESYHGVDSISTSVSLLLTGLAHLLPFSPSLSFHSLHWKPGRIQTGRISSLLFSELSQTSHLSQSALTVRSNVLTVSRSERPHHALKLLSHFWWQRYNLPSSPRRAIPTLACVILSYARHASSSCPERLFFGCCKACSPISSWAQSLISLTTHRLCLFYPSPAPEYKALARDFCQLCSLL